MRFRNRAVLSGVTALLAVGLVAPSASAFNSGTTEGCTPGYWKVQQHFDSWQETSPGVALTHLYSGSGGYSNLGGMTLADALGGGGGSGTDGAARILVRAAVAAWLNSAYDDPAGGSAMQYPWRRWSTGEEGRPPLVATVNAALASGDRARMLDLAALLDADNNLGCPLS